MQDMQDMIERLNHSGRKLSKGHRRIAQYIVEHYDKAVFMTASRLGESVGVSESTVVRFAAVLGYEGYPQLQRALQELVSHRLTAVQRFEMSSEIDPNAVLRTVLKSDMQNIRATVEELDNHAFEEGVKRILNAKEIYVIGLRSAAPLAQFLGYYLNYIFDRVHLVSSAATDVFEEIARISEADVVIGISFPRYSTRTVEAMRFARSCGAHRRAHVPPARGQRRMPQCLHGHGFLCGLPGRAHERHQRPGGFPGPAPQGRAEPPFQAAGGHLGRQRRLSWRNG